MTNSSQSLQGILFPTGSLCRLQTRLAPTPTSQFPVSLCLNLDQRGSQQSSSPSCSSTTLHPGFPDPSQISVECWKSLPTQITTIFFGTAGVGNYYLKTKCSFAFYFRIGESQFSTRPKGVKIHSLARLQPLYSLLIGCPGCTFREGTAQA
jgi:hypothetical protein